MLCFLFMFHVFLFHAYNVKYSARYRKLTTHDKIKRAYQSLRISAWGLHCFFSPHNVIKHLAVLSPKSANILLWIIPACPGFDLVLSCSMLHPYLGLVVSCTYPLTLLQAGIVLYGVL
jgi:hypothetical protein